MNARVAVACVLASSVLAATAYGAYRLGQHGRLAQERPTAVAAGAAGTPDPVTGKKVLYWHDPMVPGRKFDKPGKSPFMDMQLVPVYADDADDGSVHVSPRMQQNLGMRTAEAVLGTLAPVVEVTGSIAYDERDLAVLQARSGGYVEKLHVHAPLDPVRKGQVLAELYVPEWVAAQEEFFSARRIAQDGFDGLARSLVDGARQRMRLAGMSEAQIREVEDTGSVHARLGVTAPIAGVISELDAREGMTVTPGATLFRINGLSTVWVNAEVPESLAAQVAAGNAVQVHAPAVEGMTFRGRVGAVLPEINPAIRTLTARIELANPGGRLTPGMFVTVNLAPAKRPPSVLVPTEAVIRTGTRSVVVLAREDGGFTPVDVDVGLESAGRSEIRKGLEAGQKVVVSGQFLIDSEASLRGTATRMEGSPPQSDASRPREASPK
ncbi:MAG TPA: efflux RND transporter periplasmic adaptor subunit [Burkholderiales bacterium]|nr:efflux RND transporter periplasmic adaptor subunit [Burkholderiales bacterium]